MDGLGKYINPFTDFGFKKLFGSAFNKELLIDFLNQVLSGQAYINDLIYMNTESLGTAADDRKAVFDLHCTDSQGKRIIIELQKARQEYFVDRSIFYASHAITHQRPRGKKWDYHLPPVYTICILNFSCFGIERPGRYRFEGKVLDVASHEELYSKLTCIYLEMPNFNKAEAELETTFDKWMFVLKHLGKLQERPASLQERIFDKLFSEAEIAKLSPEEMENYRHSLKTEWDNYSALKTQWNLGKKEGIEKVALEMLKDGAPVEKIIRYTGRTHHEIEALKN